MYSRTTIALLAATTLTAACSQSAEHQPPAWQLMAEVDHISNTQVDILFVIDNSGSMVSEQALLTENIQYLLEELIRPTPDSSDVTPRAVEELHVGVVSTDMGTSDYRIATCSDPDAGRIVGDNGVLQNRGALAGCEATGSAPDCAGSDCAWLTHSTEFPDADPADRPIWEDFACIGILGSGGCGFEQHLEASLVALTTQAAPGQPNAGFLRENSLVVVVYVSDEDDGSAATPEIFDPENEDLPPLNVRAAEAEELLHPVSRYSAGLRALRPEQDGRVVVAGIVGIPTDGSWEIGDSLSALDALQRVVPERPNELEQSCQTGIGAAWHPVRLVELAYAFGASGFLSTICRERGWDEPLTSLARHIQTHLRGACIPASEPPIEPDTCRLVEVLTDAAECPHPADEPGPGRTTGWHVDLGIDSAGHRRCEILSADADGDGCPDTAGAECACDRREYGGCLQGWFYERAATPCEAGGRVSLTDLMQVGAGTGLLLECLAASG